MSETESRAIEKIAVGDLIWSKDERDPGSPVVLKEVTATMVRVSPVLELHVRDRIIETTGEHPFYVSGKGWREAHFIEASDRIATSDGEWVQVAEVVNSQRIASVYNLEVKDFHTYVVGEAGWGFDVWTHNHNPFDPNNARPGARQEGVDPNSLRPGQRSSLDADRLRAIQQDLEGGIRKPIKITPEGVIDDGHHRARVGADNGLGVPVEVVPGNIKPGPLPIGQPPIHQPPAFPPF